MLLAPQLRMAPISHASSEWIPLWFKDFSTQHRSYKNTRWRSGYNNKRRLAPMSLTDSSHFHQHPDPRSNLHTTLNFALWLQYVFREGTKSLSRYLMLARIALNALKSSNRLYCLKHELKSARRWRSFGEDPGLTTIFLQEYSST